MKLSVVVLKKCDPAKWLNQDSWSVCLLYFPDELMLVRFPRDQCTCTTPLLVLHSLCWCVCVVRFIDYLTCLGLLLSITVVKNILVPDCLLSPSYNEWMHAHTHTHTHTQKKKKKIVHTFAYIHINTYVCLCRLQCLCVIVCATQSWR